MKANRDVRIRTVTNKIIRIYLKVLFRISLQELKKTAEIPIEDGQSLGV
jgi:hypothetical protein